MEMDIDDQQLKRVNPAKILPIDENHPFDFEQYITNYSGRTLVDRLLFLIPQCPSLVSQAIAVAEENIKRMRDINLYAQLMTAYDQACTAAPPEDPLPPFSEVVEMDQAWIEETNRKNMEDRAKLEVELKTYTSNMIKESIRVSGVPSSSLIQLF
jgi:COP9 signalosome complex subunit 1